MGAKESKPSCISYEEAIKRVSATERRRIREAFKKSVGPNGNYLSQSAFQEEVLCEGVPSIVAEWLYVACGGTSKGITFTDLFCGLVLLKHGTTEERIRLLWNLYSNDSGNYILKSDYTKALSVESNLHSFSSSSTLTSATPPIPENNDGLINTSIILSLFSKSDRVNFEQFRDWIKEHKKCTILSKWLLIDSCMQLSSEELETPTFYQSLAGVTHLEERDIGDLEKEFFNLQNLSINRQLDLETLGPLISPPIPKAALIGVFNAFDENRDGHIDFKELCCGVSAACRGPNVERSKFCFKVFDIDRDGILNYDEIQSMVDVLMFVAKESRNANNYKNITKTQVISDLLKFVHIDENSSLSLPTSSSIETDIPIEKTLESNNTASNLEFSLTQEDFMMWNIESSLNLVQPFLDLYFEVCHIVFGLRPQCKHLEYEIVKGWLSREERRGYKVGQFWYLISKDWWNSWLQHTQTYSLVNPCSHCKNAFGGAGSVSGGVSAHIRQISGVDEAMVCDESFTSNSSESMGDLLAAADSSSLGSGSSGISCGGHTHHSSRLGPIDNSNLVIPNTAKNVRVLTGEGGRLKKDILIQRRDFELIPKSLWKALSRWYNDILPLPRQVILPPNSTEVELELYPLNLQILLHQNIANMSQSLTSWSAVTGGYSAITPSGGYTAITSIQNALHPLEKYTAYTAAFSRLATVKLVTEFLSEILKLKSENVRLWHVISANSSILLDEETENSTLQELHIRDNDKILLEIRNKDLTWPEELGSLSLNNSSGSTHLDRRQTSASVLSLHAPGATGLHNLGNTCFMNAALQVLFNTQPLTQYFKMNMHLYELNTTNKLGTKGQLATQYGELLKEIWAAQTRSIAPLKLRFCVTKNAPQFAGGGQHDCQELLEWLLDALHEDLNRVTEKPYTELKDSDGRPDEIVAKEAWALHHSRNQSIVIDLFYGQLKSKVSCLCCGLESVRFDPFSLLSLPLPVENFVYFEILVILLDGSLPIKYGCKINSDSKYYDLKKQLASLCYLNPNLMLFCELQNSQIKCILTDEQKIKVSTATELYCYQLPEGGDESRSRTSSIMGINIEKGLKDIQRSPALILASESTQQNQQQQHQQLQSLTSSSLSASTTNNKAIFDLSENSDSQTSEDVNVIAINEYRRPSSKKMAYFQQSTEISASPENTFVNTHRKRISTTNLLNDNSPYNTHSSNNSSDENSIEKISSNIITNSDDAQDELKMRDIRSFDCPCRSNTNSLNYKNHHQQQQQQTLNDSMDYNLVNTSRGNYSSYFSPTTSTEITNMNNNNNNGNNSFNGTNVGRYLIAIHRKLIRQDTYFLSHHKTKPSLFGVPLLIPCYENSTNKDIYCAVWMQVNRLLSPLPPTADQANHAADCDDSLGYDFPFTLRAVTNDGRMCALCPWSSFCRGCEIPCNDDLLFQGKLISNSSSNYSSNSSTPTLSHRFSSLPNLQGSKSSLNAFSTTANLSAINIAIDWDPTALHLRYQNTRERLWIEHESVAICRRQQIEPVDLNHCLRSFTSEEKLETWYHCRNCKGKKPATKKLQIWRLPPILIIHLKRFNFVNDKWVKSQKVVNFPFENFDPTPYLASVPQETILRHKELLEMKANNNKNIDNNHRDLDKHEPIINENDGDGDTDVLDGSGDTSEIGKIKPLSINNNNNNTNNSNNLTSCNPLAAVTNDKLTITTEQNQLEQNEQEIEQNKSNSTTPTRKLSTTKIEKRKRLISTSLARTPVIDGHLKDFHHHHLKNGEDHFDPKYNLYAVVSHSGMLNGGHYVSYAANPNGFWYCYNDSSCREIHSRPNIDPSSAYLLFYERRGLDYKPYLPNIEGRNLPNGNAAIDLDNDNDNDLKKLCTIT